MVMRGARLIVAAPSALLLLSLTMAQPTLAAPSPLSPADQQVLHSLKPPLQRLVVTSPYGWRLNPIRRTKLFHAGVDYGAPSGTPVYAAQNGTVESLGLKDRAGIYLRLQHSKGVSTAYAHLHRIMPGLRRGSYLRAGDVIGFVGESGFATGPHLHYEILVNGAPVNPDLHGNVASMVSVR